MAAKRGRRRKAAGKGTGGRGMLPWYAVGLLALAGIVFYDNSAHVMPKLFAERQRAAAVSHPAMASVAASAPAAPAVPSPTFRPAQPSASASSMPMPPAAIPAVSSAIRPPAPTPVSAPAAAASPQRFALCGEGQHGNCIIDGGTIWLDGVKIALADIDAPDPAQPRCTQETKLGTEAKIRLQGLLNAGTFVVTPSGRGEDDRGRQPRILMREGRSIGDQMVREGLARRWSGHHEAWCAA